MDEVLLVNKKDEVLGTMEKLEAHKKGLLHRAFSVIIFNDAGQMLLHKRASEKYHCGGLWTNTCCSHPRLGEDVLSAGKRRLMEEMGFITELEHVGSFIYKVKFDNGLFEHELDHLLIGKFSSVPNPNKQEVEEWKFMDIDEVYKSIKLHPEQFTFWFKSIMLEHDEKIFKKIKYNESL